MAEQIKIRHHQHKTGIVVSSKMDKTVVVVVQNRKQHPRYKKYHVTHSKFYAHDEKQEFLEGDVVEITGCRPLSKQKRWRVTKLVRRPSGVGVDLSADKPKTETTP